MGPQVHPGAFPPQAHLVDADGLHRQVPDGGVSCLRRLDVVQDDYIYVSYPISLTFVDSFMIKIDF